MQMTQLCGLYGIRPKKIGKGFALFLGFRRCENEHASKRCETAGGSRKVEMLVWISKKFWQGLRPIFRIFTRDNMRAWRRVRKGAPRGTGCILLLWRGRRVGRQGGMPAAVAVPQPGRAEKKSSSCGGGGVGFEQRGGGWYRLAVKLQLSQRCDRMA